MQAEARRVGRFKIMSTPLKVTALKAATKKGDLKEMQQHLMDGADVNESGGGDPVLFLAVFNNDVDALELLSNAGADLENEDPRGFRALHVAADFGKLDAMKWLLEKGVNWKHKDRVCGKTALACAKEGATDSGRQQDAVALLEAWAVDHGGIEGVDFGTDLSMEDSRMRDANGEVSYSKDPEQNAGMRDFVAELEAECTRQGVDVRRGDTQSGLYAIATSIHPDGRANFLSSINLQMMINMSETHISTSRCNFHPFC